MKTKKKPAKAPRTLRRSAADGKFTRSRDKGTTVVERVDEVLAKGYAVHCDDGHLYGAHLGYEGWEAVVFSSKKEAERCAARRIGVALVEAVALIARPLRLAKKKAGG